MTNEIRKEAKAYAFRNDGYGYDLNTCEDIFSDGAEWMYKEFEKNRLVACDNQTEEEYERELEFVGEFLDKNHRIPTISDVIEITRKQMIQKACEWLKKNTYSVFVKSCSLFDAVEEFVENFKQEMEGGEK